MKSTIKKIARKFGYEIRKRAISEHEGYELYNYLDQQGSFDYQKYRQTQIEGNKRKLDQVWALEENIAFLSSYIKSVIGPVNFGLCHGTRRGKEQQWFGKYLNANILGTDISDTAEQFPDTIEWDFHKVKPEWLNSVDFIYSNSFDHSYDPQECIKAWMSCLKEGGMCIIEHTSADEKSTELDPFGAQITIMPYLVLEWGKGDFFVRELLDAPKRPNNSHYVKFLIIQNL